MAAPTHTFEENQAVASESLDRFAGETLMHLINGKQVPSASGDTFENYSPIDSMLLGSVSSGNIESIGE